MQNIFDTKDTQQYIDRINELTPSSQRKWGKMNVSQMLAHLNVTYSMIFEPEKHKKPGVIARFFLKKFVKDKVTNDKPYRQNLPTSPIFIMTNEKDFEQEKKKLIGYLQKVQQLGSVSFEGKVNISFGKLTSEEWNNMFAKHLNHHLEQFGV